MKQQSAKDRAFEAEKIKYRHKIKELENEIKQQAITEYELRMQQQKDQSKILEQDDWIRRLLEYMDITPEEFREKMRAEKAIGRFVAGMDAMRSVRWQ
jgi:hypothetical protein